MQKFEFCIKTRDGQRVERLKIAGRDQADAERKLKQMYHYCEIVHCESQKQNEDRQAQQPALEIISLVSK